MIRCEKSLQDLCWDLEEIKVQPHAKIVTISSYISFLNEHTVIKLLVKIRFFSITVILSLITTHIASLESSEYSDTVFVNYNNHNMYDVALKKIK